MIRNGPRIEAEERARSAPHLDEFLAHLSGDADERLEWPNDQFPHRGRAIVGGTTSRTCGYRLASVTRGVALRVRGYERREYLVEGGPVLAAGVDIGSRVFDCIVDPRRGDASVAHHELELRRSDLPDGDHALDLGQRAYVDRNCRADLDDIAAECFAPQDFRGRVSNEVALRDERDRVAVLGLPYVLGGHDDGYS